MPVSSEKHDHADYADYLGMMFICCFMTIETQWFRREWHSGMVAKGDRSQHAWRRGSEPLRVPWFERRWTNMSPTLRIGHIIKHHETSWNIIKQMKHHETSWNIIKQMKHHETSWNIMKHHETSWNIMKHHETNETSWNIMKHHETS